MSKYRIYYTVTFHPRPLAGGGFVGERSQIQVKRIFESPTDEAARLRLPEIMDGKADLPRTPLRTTRADKLTEINNNGVDIREVPIWIK